MNITEDRSLEKIIRSLELEEKSEFLRSQSDLHTLEIEVKNRVFASTLIVTLAIAWFQHTMRQG